MPISMRNILIIGLCVSLGACAFKKEDAEDKQRQDLADDVAKKIQEDQKNSVVELKESTVPVTFEEKDLGDYEFKIQWPDSIGSVEIYLNNQYQETVTGKNYFKRIVSQGEQISYRIRAYASIANGGVLIGEYENIATAPVDLLVYNSRSLNADLKMLNVNRAYFRTDTKIITNGFDLTIIARTLIVEDVVGTQNGKPGQYSQIVTHPTHEPSKTNRSSNIKIKADRAIGKLQIAMIGKDGHNGKDGNDYAVEQGLSLLSPRAADGAKGADGIIERGQSCAGKKNPDTCVNTGDKCKAKPTNGTNGADGANGFPGQDGENGGDAGFVKIEVTDDSEFFLEIYQKPGKGGLGGKGSAGQLGGKGGAPGNRPSACTEGAAAGSDGKNGAPGADGKNGADGRAIILETKVRNQRVI
ncbi:hypothetical protein [Bdellovibrio sp. KM01]|uniref:hypothetical protein n=1 Tax=Bdellovibrio sp. KM01 TaxID=2748865 RepID=UPI0015E967A8|nr:hypothetical protein [Bdellovibrio sp. KM01]QLY27062.1 hypothetical protein HW988_08730 [Bdellovibrio sp. KM01]